MRWTLSRSLAGRLTHTWTGRPSDHHLRRLAERLVDDLLGQLADQVRLLGEPDELGRGQHAATRVRPAGQRLHPDGLAVGQPYLGLEVQLDLPAQDRAAQVTGERQPLRRVAVGLGHVPLDPAVPLLGQVHSDIGALHQLVETVGVVGIDGDSDARLHLERHGLEPDRLGERGPQPRGDLARRGGLLDRGQQHGELVTAEAGHDIAWPDAVREAMGHDLQQPVPDGVTEGVVDLLETGRPVEVDQQEPRPGAGEAGAGQRLAAPPGQQLAVEQAGQLVVVRLVFALRGLRGVEVDGREREGEERDDDRRLGSPSPARRAGPSRTGQRAPPAW